MKKIAKFARFISIDVLVYSMRQADKIQLPNIDYKIDKTTDKKGRENYVIMDNNVNVHRSICFNNVYLLKLLKKKGPAIGDCYTSPAYRGRSIYPFVINYIAGDLFSRKQVDEVFIVVNSSNSSSIKGIEKANFKFVAKIKTRRFLYFYFDTKISTK